MDVNTSSKWLHNLRFALLVIVGLGAAGVVMFYTDSASRAAGTHKAEPNLLRPAATTSDPQPGWGQSQRQPRQEPPPAVRSVANTHKAEPNPLQPAATTSDPQPGWGQSQRQPRQEPPPAVRSVADTRWPYVLWLPDQQAWQMPECRSRPGKDSAPPISASCFYRGRCDDSTGRCQCDSGYAGRHCSEWDRSATAAGITSQWLFGWLQLPPQQPYLGDEGLLRPYSATRGLHAREYNTSGPMPGSCGRDCSAAGPNCTEAYAHTTHCQKSWLGGMIGEIVKPPGWDLGLWRRQGNHIGSSASLLSTPVDDLNKVVQSTWNAKEGRQQDLNSLRRQGFDLQAHDGVVTRVAESDSGQWRPTPECPTPRLWLVLFGHYRTWDFTRETQVDAARMAAGNCYFVVAAVWPDIGASANDHGNIHAMYSADSSKRSPVGAEARGVVSKAHMLEAAADFGGRMAFAILTRDFLKLRKDKKARAGTLATGLPWHVCWALARWAATKHGFTIDPHSVVLRTRPDFRMKESLDLAPLQRVFQQGTDDELDGSHLSIGSLGASDVFMITSFTAFEIDIALPIHVGMATGGDMGRIMVEIGLTNGWQMGLLKWEQRLRPPMMYTVEHIWLGTIVRAKQLSLPDQAKYFADIRGKEWPRRRVDMTKGVHALLPANAPKQPDGLWFPQRTEYLPRFDRSAIRYATKLGNRGAFQPHNLTDWVSPAEDGQPRTHGSNELRCDRTCNVVKKAVPVLTPYMEHRKRPKMWENVPECSGPSVSLYKMVCAVPAPGEVWPT